LASGSASTFAPLTPSASLAYFFPGAFDLFFKKSSRETPTISSTYFSSSTTFSSLLGFLSSYSSFFSSVAAGSPQASPSSVAPSA